MKPKLSASALATFLDSPKKYYWNYVRRLVPAQLSVTTFDHDKLAGTCWAAAVDRFYKGIAEAENRTKTLKEWEDSTDGWVPATAKTKLTTALESWISEYYQKFSPADGIRGKGKSELWVENDIFCGRLDGLSDDGIVHEVKSTSRAKIFTEQVWKVEHSIQVRLYCVLTGAAGYCVEFAFKDAPHQIARCNVQHVTAEQRENWEQELNALATMIYSLGDDEHNYPCHTDCIICTKNFTGTCAYAPLCEFGLTEETSLFYKAKAERK